MTGPSQPTAGRKQPPRVELEIMRGRAKQMRRPVTGPAFLIGAAKDCDLVLGDPQFPAVHTYLRRDENGCSIRSLGFAPQLYVNGRPVEAAHLANGDILRLGPYEFRVAIRFESGVDLRTVAPDETGNPDEPGAAAVRSLMGQVRQDERSRPASRSTTRSNTLSKSRQPAGRPLATPPRFMDCRGEADDRSQPMRPVVKRPR